MTVLKRKIAAILAADIAGYSRLVSEDEEDTLLRLASYREVFEDFVRKSGGRVCNTAGDSLLVEFPSAVECTRCAIDIQESLRTRNMGFAPSRQMLFRIGITLGDVVERDGDLLGDGVNIAARLEGLAEPGGICVSQSVFEQVANKMSVPFRDIGMQEVKNIPHPVHAFRVEMRGAEGELARKAAITDRNAPSSGGKLPVLLGFAGIGVGAAALALLFMRPPDANAPTPSPQSPIAQQVAPPIVAQPTEPPRGTLVPPGATPADAFAILAKSGGIVQNAKTPPELYHNARSFEARGDALSARRDYLALATQGGDAIDPHLRFAALLRAQDGRAGAREIYARLAEQTTGRAASLVHALQFEGEERRKRVEALSIAHTDYAPAQYLLAEEFTQDRLGSQTIADKRREMEAMGRFLEAETDGRLVPFFLDQSVLAEWAERARKSHASLRSYLETATLTPTATFMRSNAGWMVAISPPEAATSLYWRNGPSGEFNATGHMAALDPRTGKPVPNTSFELPGNVTATTIDVRYDDAAGRTIGPFPIRFDPRIELIRGQRDILERFSNSWIAFGANQPRADWVYYTQLMSFRCAIAKAEIGYGDVPPTNVLPMPPCNERDPHSIPSDAKPYVSVPAALKMVSVRLTWADGSQSPVKVFSRQ